mgnify:CR=1 FL=1
MSDKIIEGSTRSRDVFLSKCKNHECQVIIRTRRDSLKKASGYCKSHVQQKLPFQSIYNGLFNDQRGTDVHLTYEEYIEFTKTKTCHYCDNDINWVPYATVKGVFKSRAYYLDRKDFCGPYSKSNCVVCCTRCNMSRGNNFTYEEWFGMTKYLRENKDV